MLKTFEDIAKNFKLKPQTYNIDNWIFKLHYKVTVLMFLISTVLVCSRQYIGEHIRCISDHGVPEHVMNTFCFFTSTFTVVDALDAKLLDRENLAHPGVGPYGIHSSQPIKRHAYYQWVPFVLFGQGLMFYLTHLLWKKLEGGRLRYLVDGLKLAAFALNEKEVTIDGKKIPTRKDRDAKIQQIRDIFVEGVYINKYWSLKMICCEILNLLHVVLQIYITNKFLNGNFYNLGVDIWTDGLESSVDILDEVFPKITKCTFHKYGPSGSIQLHDAMCVMALNIINDKIYTFLWFWFIILFSCSCLGVFWRALTIVLHARSQLFNRLVYYTTCPGHLNPWDSLTVSKHCNFSDWLFLKYLSKNIDGMVFKEILMRIAEQLDETNKPSIQPLLSTEKSELY